MTDTNTHGAGATHGGARLKQRDDDGRGGARPGAGPKPKSFTLKLGDRFYIGRNDASGAPVDLGETWTIAEIARGYFVVSSSNGDSYRIVR